MYLETENKTYDEKQEKSLGRHRKGKQKQIILSRNFIFFRNMIP